IDALAFDVDPGVRHAAFYALGQLDTGDSIDKLANLASSAVHDDQLAAISALGNSQTEPAQAAIAALINSPDDELPQPAVNQASMGGSVLESALERLANDPSRSPELRAAAAERLAGH